MRVRPSSVQRGSRLQRGSRGAEKRSPSSDGGDRSSQAYQVAPALSLTVNGTPRIGPDVLNTGGGVGFPYCGE